MDLNKSRTPKRICQISRVFDGKISAADDANVIKCLKIKTNILR